MGGQPLDVAPQAAVADEPGRQAKADRCERRDLTVGIDADGRDPSGFKKMVGEQLLRIRYLVLRHSNTPVLRTSVSAGVLGTIAVRLTCLPTMVFNRRCQICERAR